MKKVIVLTLLVAAFIFQFCASSKKASVKQAAKITYLSNVQPLISATCSPCHIPPKGNKKPLDTYAAAKNNVDDMIARIQRNPTDRGFMPFKHPKLSADTINVFVQWKTDGLLEK